MAKLLRDILTEAKDQTGKTPEDHEPDYSGKTFVTRRLSDKKINTNTDNKDQENTTHHADGQKHHNAMMYHMDMYTKHLGDGTRLADEHLDSAVAHHKQYSKFSKKYDK